MDLALALAERDRRRPRRGQRPRRRPVRGRRARPRTGWRMLRGDEVGALLAHHLLGRGRTGTYATSIVSSSLLGKLAAAAGQPHEETLTGFKWIGRVDGAGVRLRGGARLLRRPRARARQGRRLGAAAALRARRAAQGRGPRAARPARRHRPRARPARHRPGLGARRRPRPDPGRDGPAARAAARPSSAGSRSLGVDDLGAGSADLPPDRRPALPPRRRRPGDRAAQRHRAQGQVLPRGRRTRRGAAPRTASRPPGSAPPGASTPSAPTSAPPPASDADLDGRGSDAAASTTSAASRAHDQPARSRATAGLTACLLGQRVLLGRARPGCRAARARRVRAAVADPLLRRTSAEGLALLRASPRPGPPRAAARAAVLARHLTPRPARRRAR